MVYNPLDYKAQDLTIIHAGTYAGQVTAGGTIALNATDLAAGKIKGGVVAYQTAANEFGVSNGTEAKYPFGIFIGDGTKSAHDVTVMFRGGTYETLNWLAADIASLTVNAKLGCNADGLLQVYTGDDAVVVGIVTKQPASTTDTLGFKLFL